MSFSSRLAPGLLALLLGSMACGEPQTEPLNEDLLNEEALLLGDAKADAAISGTPTRYPLLLVHGSDKALLTLDPTLGARGLWAVSKPRGFSDTIPFLATSYADAMKLWQVQKNLTLTGHVYAPIALVVSPAFFGSLTDAQKTAFIEGAKIGAQASRKFVDDVEKKGVDEIKSHGVNVVTQVNNAPFQAALSPAYKQYAAKYGQKTLDQIAAVK